MPLIEVEKVGLVRRLTLNRPETRNALSMELLQQLSAELETGVDDEETSVFVVQGAGKSFSSGFEFGSSYGQAKGVDPVGDRERLRRRTAHLESVWLCPLPVIAAVHGHCLAGGSELALHCDVLLVSEDASIGYPPVRNLGVPPTSQWLYRVGIQQAKRLMLTGDQISGPEAVRIGLALDCVPHDSLAETAMALAQRMALIDRRLLAGNKAALNRGIDLMGRTVLNRIAETEDAIGHLSPAAARFRADVRENGLKTALHHRDNPFAQ